MCSTSSAPRARVPSTYAACRGDPCAAGGWLERADRLNMSTIIYWYIGFGCQGRRMTMEASADAPPPATAVSGLLTSPILPTLLKLALPNAIAMLGTALVAVAETS